MNIYAKPSQFDNRIVVSAAAAGLLLELIEAASREVDNFCRRRFFTWTGAERLTACTSGRLNLQFDLRSVTELAIDRNSDRTYAEIWTTSDYELVPYDAPQALAILTKPLASYSFPTAEGAVKITGLWGYGDGVSASPWKAETVTGTIGATGTDLVLSLEGALEAGQTIKIGDEQLYIESVDGVHATVERAVNGTTAAAHSGADVNSARYPKLVQIAVINLVVDYWNQREGAEMTSEKWQDYEYQRANLSTFAEFRKDQLARMLGPYALAVMP